MKKLFLMTLVCVTTVVFAQKMKVTQGDLKFLKGVTELELKMDYSQTKFYKENMDENGYLEKRMKEISADKGDEEAQKWKKDWENSKENSFKDKFAASWDKNSNIKISTNAPYTIIVETVWIYPGWFGGVMSQPAKVSTILKFVDSKNPSQILAIIESTNAPGDGNFVGVANNNDRIAEGYAKTAKSLANMVGKKVK